MNRHRPSRRTAALGVILLAGLLGACGAKDDAGNSPFSPYVALGDSYTAAPPDSSPAGLLSGCPRSDDNYPALVALHLGISDLEDRSCGGAQTKDMREHQRKGVSPQLDALDEHTRLVSVSIGGDDFDIGVVMLSSCPAAGIKDRDGSPCTDAASAQATDPVLSKMSALTDRITRVLGEIKDRAPHARILVVGYPQIVPASGTCDAYPAGSGDYPYMRSINSGINDAARRAAQRKHDTFIDIWAASAGHDVCADDPWVSPYVESPSAADAAPLHPLPPEQEEVARLIEAALPTGTLSASPSTSAD